MNSILYITDLYYEAKGRNYYEEDLYITSELKNDFNILICHPQQALAFLNTCDLIVIRNSGPVIDYQDYFNEFINEVNTKNIPTFNSMDGKADMKGKQYLTDLTMEGLAVIPTVELLKDTNLLGNVEKYLLKTKYGADSIGMKVINKAELAHLNLDGYILQPFLEFEYEVSFYFINEEFQYALYAPDKTKRWELKEFQPNQNDLNFAYSFIKWNDMKCGIQRVDACRMNDGSLLLVELEDLNPFLSLDLLPSDKKQSFISNFSNALNNKIKEA